MSYNIKRFNGDALTVVNDGTIDNTVDLKLIGKNYAGYGEIQNENFVYLLENFANNNPPPKPSAGQFWFDSSTNKMKFYDKSTPTPKWRSTGGSEVSSTQPTGLTIGDFWYDTTHRQLYVCDPSLPPNNPYVLIGPQSVGEVVTEMHSRTVYDDAGNSHLIIEAITNNVVVYIICSDTRFVLDNTRNAITGFNEINQGLTLAYTDGSTDNNPGLTNSSHRWWGTATNADKLGGHLANEFALVNNPTFTGVVKFGDDGFTVGNTPRLHVYVDNGIPHIQNQSTDTIIFETTSGTIVPAMKLVGSNILPGGVTTDIGTSTAKFRSVYATTFAGLADESKKLVLDNGISVIATIANSPSTIVGRSANGVISATTFDGTATQARYADLAEKYLTDIEYEVGTVVIVGGEKEVTASQSGKRAIGVVSKNPAYMMNSDLEGGTYIALKGRVPVKVYGSVKKGSNLVAGNNGTAVIADPGANDVFAIALESSTDLDTKLIECVIL